MQIAMNHSIYIVRFSGQNITTTVTDMSYPVDEWINHVRSMQGRLIVGLDCEWKPRPSPGMSHKTAILQLCIHNTCLIVQIFYMSHVPQSLKSFLSDPSITFVGAGIGRDVSKLRNDYGLIVFNAVDVEPIALACAGYSLDDEGRLGLKAIAREVVGLSIEKPRHLTMSNWETRVLSPQQIEYACIDAYASHKIGYKLLVEYSEIIDWVDVVPRAFIN